MFSYTFSLIIPCYNEASSIEACLSKVKSIANEQLFSLEIIVVDDASIDDSLSILEKIKAEHKISDGNVTFHILKHEKNRGKGAALRTGLLYATGDFVGIQDADTEYDPKDYMVMLEPLLDGRADVVYGSRYLRPDTRRVLYFWHTWMNKTLTTVSNMFTNLDITDMETCYKLFRREVIQTIAPTLKEDRFGFEPEVTTKVAQGHFRVYECAISYNPRTYEEGKKIGWKDGVHALYCILHYGAQTAPLPMQLLLYFFIGFASMAVNIVCFTVAVRIHVSLDYAIWFSFALAGVCNYLLCISILFRHKVRWNTLSEVFFYIVSVSAMGFIDYGVTRGLIALSWSLLGAKILAALIGFGGNFLLRKWLVFPNSKHSF
jgi:glycosyltransferase involved in cell wall biosynthesis